MHRRVSRRVRAATRSPRSLLLLATLTVCGSGMAAAQSVDRYVPDGRLRLDEPSERALQRLVERITGGPDIAGSLDTFFADPAVVGNAYVPVDDVVAYRTDAPAADACGPASSVGAGNATYCAASGTVAYDYDWLRQLYQDVGPAGPATVIAHAWGTYVAEGRGAGSGMAASLQADCYAGMYLRWLGDRGGILGDARAAAARMFAPARTEPAPATLSPWFDTGSHGGRIERRQATGVGYDSDDVRACHAYATGVPPPIIALESPFSLHLPVGAGVRQAEPDVWLVSLPGAEVEVAIEAPLDPLLPVEALRGYLLSRFGPDLGSEVVSGGFPDDPAWSAGSGASLTFALPATDGAVATSGLAAIGTRDGRADIIVVILPTGPMPADPMSVLRAVSWGFCDPAAADPSGCEPALSAAPGATPEPTPANTPDVDEARRRRRQAEQALIAGAPFSFADTCRRYRGSSGAADPFVAGATAAISCEVGARHVAEYAVYQFLQSTSRDRYYFGRAYLTGLREGRGSCADGRGEQPWAHGRVACWVSPTAPQLAHVRWTDDRTTTYGVLDGTDVDIDALYRWWRRNVGDL